MEGDAHELISYEMITPQVSHQCSRREGSWETQISPGSFLIQGA